MRDVDLVELAPRMGPARDFGDRSIFIKLLEACICICLERTLVELEVLLRVFGLAIGRVGEPDGRSGIFSGGPVIADIGPEPSDLRPPLAGASTGTGVSSACSLLADMT
jgi:hypothetical protein